MRLLFGQNLSPRLIVSLADAFPGSTHVSLTDLDTASDADVWNYARDNDLVIVTKDSDFSDMGILRGFPPKIIWLRLGNCTTGRIEDVLMKNRELIESWGRDPGAGILELQ